MRVALLLSGQFRNSYKEYKSIKEKLIDKYNTDVFISYTHTKNNLDVIPSDLLELYKPKNLEFIEIPAKLSSDVESIKGFNRALETNPTSLYSMWYGIKKTNDLKIKYELENNFKYDIVIKSRFDIEFRETIKLHKEPNSLSIPIGSDHRGGYNDLFAYGSSDIMDYYTSVYDYITDYIKEGCLIHPERILKHHLDKKDFKFYRRFIPIILRGTTITEVDYSLNP